MSDPNKLIDQEWSEEDLCKMSCKELRKIAIQRNINPKLKKAQLVDALLNSAETVCEQTECKDISVIGRATRSRTSTLRTFDSNLNCSLPTNTASDKSTSIKTLRAVPKMTEDKQENKKQRKRPVEESKQTINLFEKDQNGKPLLEISNSNKLLGTDYNYCDSVFNKSDSLMESKQSRRENRLGGRSTLCGNEVNINNDFSRSCVSSNQHVDESEAKGSNVTSNIEEPTTKRRGRKKKTTKVLNRNVVIPTIVVDCFDDQINEDKVFREQTSNKESTNDHANRLDTIAASENMEETREDIQNGFPDINVHEPTDIKNGRKCVRKLAADLNNGKSISEIHSVISSEIGTDETPSSSQETSTQKDETPSEEISLNCTREESNKTTGPKEVSPTNSESENTPVPALVRSSTFTLDNEEPMLTNRESENKPVPSMVRSSTFTLDNKDAEQNEIRFSGLKRSNTFTICDEDPGDKSTPSKVAKGIKSIGERILSSSMKTGRVTSSKKKNGSTVKKTITKNSNTPALLFKANSGVVRKAPNFKAIHQKLFENMESLSDNRLRNLARAESLMRSPAPRCAVKSPSLNVLKDQTKSNHILKSGIPQKIHSPVKRLPVPKDPTPASEKTKNKNALTSTATNSYGCNSKPVDRNVAKSTIGMKLPPAHLEKKRDEDRAYIQGVRTNKRFLLQMKMRQNN